MEKSNEAKAGFGGLFVGFIIGITTGLLYAPKKGEELRSDIANKISEGQKKIEDSIKKGQETAKEEIDEMKRRLRALGEKSGEALETEKDMLERKIETYVQKASKVDDLEKRVKELEANSKKA